MANVNNCVTGSLSPSLSHSSQISQISQISPTLDVYVEADRVQHPFLQKGVEADRVQCPSLQKGMLLF